MTKANVWTWTKRFFFYILGMFIIAFGVNIAINSELGVSPNNSVPLVLSRKFTALSMGTWVSIIFSLFVVLQLFILWKDFKWYYVFQFAVSTVFGFFVDWTAFLCGWVVPVNYFVRVLYVLLSTVLIALGILLYLEPNVMSMPAEGVAVALSKRTKRPLSTCKIFFDVLLTAIAVTLSLIFFKKLDGIGVGTVIIAFGVGYVIKWLAKLIKKPLHTLIFGKEKEE